MEVNLLEIKNGIGFENLRFGMIRDEVLAILGEPNEKETHGFVLMEDDITENWHYDNFELSLGFEKLEGWQLIEISVSSPLCTFKKFHPIGISKEELKQKLNDLGHQDLVYEDYSTVEDPANEVLTCEPLEISFWFEEDVLKEVQWGPFYTEDESVIWPKIQA